MKLTKAGAGRLTFSGTNTYTGATLIAEGAFVVNGSLPSSPVTSTSKCCAHPLASAGSIFSGKLRENGGRRGHRGTASHHELDLARARILSSSS